MTTHTINLRTRAGLWTDCLEPLRTVFDNRRYTREGLDVLYDGWTPKQTVDRGKRGLDARVRALSFQRLDQTGLLTADVCPSTAVNVDVQIVAGAEDVLAEQAVRIGFGNRLL